MKTFLRVALVLGGVFLFSVFGVVACVTATSFLGVSDSSEKVERTESRELQLSAASRVKVSTPYGNVRVRTTDAGGGSMHAHVVARGKSIEDAQLRLDRTRIVIEESSEGVVISVDFKRESRWVNTEPDPSVDFEVLVPVGVKLDLASSSGEVAAEGGPFAESRLKSNYGDVSIVGVKGDVTVESSSGDVAITHHSGGRATAKTSYGDVRVSDVDAASLHAKTSSGSVKAERIRAPTIELESSYGDIDVDSATGQIAVQTSSGSIDVLRSGPQVAAKSSYGAVKVEGVLEVCSAHSSSGEVHVIAREGSTISSEWRITSAYGRISLEAPQDAKFDLDAKTAYGEVEVEYAIELPPGAKTNKGSALRGKVNGGGALVSMKSSSGSVSVTRLQR